MSSAAAWRRCSSKFRCWRPSSAASTSKCANKASGAIACWLTATPWLRPRPNSCRICKHSWRAVASNSTFCRRAWANCKNKCRNWTSSAAKRSRRSTTKPASRRTWPRGWKPSRRCKKKYVPTANSSRGCKSTACRTCRSCGRACTCKMAGKTPWKPRCASAWPRWKWGGLKRYALSRAMPLRPN